MMDNVEIDCNITDPRDTHITGDVEVFSEGFREKIIEVEGLTFSPFAGATVENDRCVFQESFLCHAKPNADVIFGFHLSVSPEQREALPWYRQALLKNAELLFHLVNDGKHPFAPQTWVSDTREDIFKMMDSYPTTDADFNLTKAVGEHLLLPSVLNGDASILQYMTKDNYLERYYVDAIGFQLLNFLIAGVMEQLCLKSPRMNFLEVGAGTGGATKAILEKIGYSYASYTYTDIFSAFFDHAAGHFQSHASKMIFKALDITKDPAGQGFIPQSYDVIVASNVLHATESLRSALEHTRRLLRPGGYLVMVEIIRNDVMRHGLVMGGLPGWWVGENDGRYGGPSITLDQWDKMLRETGFSGIETNSPMRDPVGVPGSIIVSRAETDLVTQLTRPLSSKFSTATDKTPLLIIGGISPFVSPFRDQICLTLRRHFGDIIKVEQFADLPPLPECYHVLSLTECDANLFEDMEESVFLNLKTVLGSALSVLWLLRDRRSSNPHAGTTLGLFRTLFYEVPGTLLQTLDIDVVNMDDCSVIAESMCQLRFQSDMARRGETDEIRWEFEPELVLKDGELYVPRVRPHDGQNNRYNSSKRLITHNVDVHTTPLALDLVDGSYMPTSPFCNKVKMSSLTASEASFLPHDAPKTITDLLRHVASFASSLVSTQATPEGAPLDILPLKRVAANFAMPNPRSLVYWREDQYVPVSVEPVTQRGDLFRPDRTYWLAGLTGDTGRSLADFMIAHNARNIVLSSRTPTVYKDWVEWHKSRGVSVRYFGGDITSFQSVKQIHDAIKESMLPIGGVANGAMVLRDSSFMKVSFDDFQAVLGPNVKGTINIDRLFSDPNQLLDWFIGFSSVAGTVGNPGQSGYTAGNCFIKALVDWRRKQGLAGSVIDITRLVGLGFIEREGHGRLTKEHQERLTTRSGTIAMSENDLHQLFAEAISAGRPDLDLNPEIITGLAPITVEQSKDTYWTTNPRLSLLIREAGQGDLKGRDGGNAAPLRQLLGDTKTMQDVANVLSGALKGKLQALKFLSDSDSLYDTTPLVDMGVDSLVAVEVRSWFLKELTVDVPLMKILGGASITDLVEVVVQKVPRELLSRLDPEGRRQDSNGDVPATVGDNDSVETVGSKMNGINSAHENGSSGVNGISGTYTPDMDSTTDLNGTNGTAVIKEMLGHKAIKGVVPILLNAQEVA
ncbi:hypothetical protein KXX57_004968 [Aspergillus fumigatus]|nr:hypothetical protein KXX57_004968 [Aspergillus fumigatus]KAH2653320.1 hypothetical protein KXV32_003451 [Aspergillus fumigatus]KAH2909840.1 hypothetical protein KXW25_003694 [Aspergillus fumigatus]